MQMLQEKKQRGGFLGN